MSTVPAMTAGRDGSALHSRLSANCPRSVLIASGSAIAGGGFGVRRRQLLRASVVVV